MGSGSRFTHLDADVLLDLARVSVRLQRDMLEVQMRGIDEITNVLDKQRG